MIGHGRDAQRRIYTFEIHLQATSARVIWIEHREKAIVRALLFLLGEDIEAEFIRVILLRFISPLDQYSVQNPGGVPHLDP
jgi:hypothetical protein